MSCIAAADGGAAADQAKRPNVVLRNRYALQKMLDAYMPGVRSD